MKIMWVSALREKGARCVPATVNPSVTSPAKRCEVRRDHAQFGCVSPRVDVMSVQDASLRLRHSASLAVEAITGEDLDKKRLPLGRTVKTLPLRRYTAAPCGILRAPLESRVGLARRSASDAVALHLFDDRRDGDASLVRHSVDAFFARLVSLAQPSLILMGLRRVVASHGGVPAPTSAAGVPLHDLSATAFAQWRLFVKAAFPFLNSEASLAGFQPVDAASFGR